MKTWRIPGKTASIMTTVIIGAIVVLPLASCTTAAHKASPHHASSHHGHTAGHVRRPGRRGAPVLVLGHGPVFGVYRPKLPESRKVTRWITRNLHPQIVELYTKFGTRFPSRAVRSNYAHGAMTLVQLDPWTVPLYRIATGKYDAYLRRYARAVAAVRVRIGFSFAHEMNGQWYPWDFRKSGPANFVAAWRRIHRIFDAMHAKKVTWVWTINKLYLRDSRPLAQVTREDWPGKRYVNWIGVDGYFRFPGEPFGRVMSPTLRLVRSITRKPVLFTETAVYPNSLIYVQMRELFAGIERDHLLGFIYFDHNARRRWELHGKAIGLLQRLLRRYGYKRLACSRNVCKPTARTR